MRVSGGVTVAMQRPFGVRSDPEETNLAAYLVAPLAVWMSRQGEERYGFFGSECVLAMTGSPQRLAYSGAPEQTVRLSSRLSWSDWPDPVRTVSSLFTMTWRGG